MAIWSWEAPDTRCSPKPDVLGIGHEHEQVLGAGRVGAISLEVLLMTNR